MPKLFLNNYGPHSRDPGPYLPVPHAPAESPTPNHDTERGVVDVEQENEPTGAKRVARWVTFQPPTKTHGYALACVGCTTVVE
jgi:hypothetical protein